MDRPPSGSLLHLDLSAGVDVRVVASPLAVAEVMLRDALNAVVDRRAPPSQRAALRRVVEAVPERRLRRLEPFLGGYGPGPLPLSNVGPEPSIDEELHAVVGSAALVLAEDAARIPAHLRPPEIDRFARDPGLQTEALLTATLRVWERVVQPMWPLVSAAVERERADAGRRAAAVGWREVLGGLHRAVRVEGDALVVDVIVDGPPVALDRRPLLVAPVPSITRGAIAGPDAVTLILPDLGIRPDAVGGLARTLGPARARTLAALRTPATTTELASRLERSPGAVSEVLQALHSAGLVARERRGLHVMYRRSDRGDALVEALDERAIRTRPKR